jgi:hypothetical protein
MLVSDTELLTIHQSVEPAPLSSSDELPEPRESLGVPGNAKVWAVASKVSLSIACYSKIGKCRLKR